MMKDNALNEVAVELEHAGNTLQGKLTLPNSATLPDTATDAFTTSDLVADAQAWLLDKRTTS